MVGPQVKSSPLPWEEPARLPCPRTQVGLRRTSSAPSWATLHLLCSPASQAPLGSVDVPSSSLLRPRSRGGRWRRAPPSRGSGWFLLEGQPRSLDRTQQRLPRPRPPSGQLLHPHPASRPPGLPSDPGLQVQVTLTGGFPAWGGFGPREQETMLSCSKVSFRIRQTPSPPSTKPLF